MPSPPLSEDSERALAGASLGGRSSSQPLLTPARLLLAREPVSLRFARKLQASAEEAEAPAARLQLSGLAPSFGLWRAGWPSKPSYPSLARPLPASTRLSAQGFTATFRLRQIVTQLETWTLECSVLPIELEALGFLAPDSPPWAEEAMVLTDAGEEEPMGSREGVQPKRPLALWAWLLAPGATEGGDFAKGLICEPVADGLHPRACVLIPHQGLRERGLLRPPSPERAEVSKWIANTT
eukprot:CAMPEP_0115529214 /NCGR_PEP_ID=MMETSP0271-20121206/83818_1 /TAXON_ID=71861 /ORGANISM="Scrippsiella trochoidea, Strain CCMP3099" /LENGTH=238 /DNA_ID=CAMNT_0002961213 /DNA_START=84 /DNA_END=803 /DNA_ORIENTATION=+